MNTQEEENLDSETQDSDGDDATEESYDESEDTSSETDEATKLRQIVEDQKRRAEKAEQRLKDLKAQLDKSKPTEPPVKSEGQAEKSPDTLSKEEVILYARGLSEEEVEKVKSIAKIEGESPLVVAESDYFKIWKDKKDSDKATQETQLGASRGSMKTKPKKDFSSADLSVEEHKHLWKQSRGL